MRPIIILVLLCALSALHAQPTSRSSFFVANEGQWPGEFSFRYDGGGGSWYVTDQGLTIDLKQYEVSPQNGLPFGGTEGGSLYERENRRPTRIKGHVLKANLVNAHSHQFPVEAHSCVPLLEGTDKLTSYSNYFFGQDKSKWRSRVGHYRKVVAKEVWPGIDVEYEAKKEGVETFFRVQPGADISQIQIEYEGLEAPLSVDSKGNLVLKTSLGSLIEKAPFAYQIENHRQREVPAHFELTGDKSYRLSVDNYNHDRELVIDPLIYSTFYESPGINEMCLDFEGNIILAGWSYGGIQTTPGAYQSEVAGDADGFISKFSSNGQELIFSTYLGGAQRESFYTCVNDLQNRIHVGGFNQDGEYPLTENAYDTIYTGHDEATHTIISEDGSALLYSSYLGGRNGEDYTNDMLLDSVSGEVYLLGTSSPGLQTTSNAIYPSSFGYGGMIVIFNPEAFEVVYATYFPTCEASAIDIYTGEVVGYRQLWIGGRASPTQNAPQFPITDDAFQLSNEFPNDFIGFFARLDLFSNQLNYSSYFGSSGADEVRALKALSDNRILLSGITNQIWPGYSFPVTNDAFDTVAVRLKSYASIIELPDQLLHSTFIGGDNRTYLEGICLSDSGCFLATGHTISSDFPVSHNAFDSTPGTGDYDAFLIELSPTLSELIYGTYIAGDERDYAMAPIHLSGDTLWIAGGTRSEEFPVTENAYQSSLHGSENTFLMQFLLPQTESTESRMILIPSDLTLSIFPNPFNPSTTISFNLPHRAQTSLEIFNLLGQSVYSIDLGQLEAGQYQHHLNAASLPSGSYLTRLDAGNVQDVKRMVLVR